MASNNNLISSLRESLPYDPSYSRESSADIKGNLAVPPSGQIELEDSSLTSKDPYSAVFSAIKSLSEQGKKNNMSNNPLNFSKEVQELPTTTEGSTTFSSFAPTSKKTALMVTSTASSSLSSSSLMANASPTIIQTIVPLPHQIETTINRNHQKEADVISPDERKSFSTKKDIKTLPIASSAIFESLVEPRQTEVGSRLKGFYKVEIDQKNHRELTSKPLKCWSRRDKKNCCFKLVNIIPGVGQIIFGLYCFMKFIRAKAKKKTILQNDKNTGRHICQEFKARGEKETPEIEKSVREELWNRFERAKELDIPAMETIKNLQQTRRLKATTLIPTIKRVLKRKCPNRSENVIITNDRPTIIDLIRALKTEKMLIIPIIINYNTEHHFTTLVIDPRTKEIIYKDPKGKTLADHIRDGDCFGPLSVPICDFYNQIFGAINWCRKDKRTQWSSNYGIEPKTSQDRPWNLLQTEDSSYLNTIDSGIDFWETAFGCIAHQKIPSPLETVEDVRKSRLELVRCICDAFTPL